MQDDYTIRIMGAEEVSLAVEWAAGEGWNPGLHDAGLFFSADPQGFLVGLLDGEPIATISAVKYGGCFGFVGFYIVRPDQRGKGYGIRIWDAAMQSLAGRTVGLDGVMAQQDNYRKSGFELAYSNVRYAGRCTGQAPAHPGIVDLSSLPVYRVQAYDRPFFPDDRSLFIHSWINQPEGKALGMMVDDELAGYGVIRKCRQGYKIGPLFADDENSAHALFLALQSEYSPDEPLYLDVPQVHPQAVSLAQDHGMTSDFETARMYAGEIPHLSVERTFGVTTFELG